MARKVVDNTVKESTNIIFCDYKLQNIQWNMEDLGNFYL